MASADARPLLRLDRVDVGYGERPILHDLSMALQRGEVISVLGRNGAGRSTLLKSIMGLADATGSIRFRGRELVGREPFRIARAGVGYVPEGREVFSRLTVEQNLELGRKAAKRDRSASASSEPAKVAPRRWSVDDMYSMFPALHERRRTAAGVLSGGEQQMLTLCRTLMGNPDLMLIDEPTEGLAPALVEQVARFIVALPQRGVSVLLVEQKLDVALTVSHRCIVLGRGSIVFDGDPADLEVDAGLRREWLEM